MLPLPTKANVVVCGAGPAGLAAAISLFKHGCKNIVVVDALERGDNTSRAMVIHASTLEFLETVGCAKPLVDAGIKVAHSVIRDRGGGTLMELDFSLLESLTPFPFVLLLPQDETERILGDEVSKLGIQVFRPERLVGMSAAQHEANSVDLLFESGQTMQTSHVIGADGARSMIRSLSGISFTDPDGTPSGGILAQMIVADVVFSDSNVISAREMRTELSHDNLVVILPLRRVADPLKDRGEMVHRVVCGVPSNFGEAPQTPTTEYIQRLLDEYTSLGSVRICETFWSSRFRTHSAIASELFVRFKPAVQDPQDSQTGAVVFLVGDAAHIHSPAGGQGMNLGLRDAVALGPILAARVDASSASFSGADIDKDLRDYARSQREHALQIIKLSKRLLSFTSGTSGSTWFARFLHKVQGQIRFGMARLLGRSQTFRLYVAKQLSGVSGKAQVRV